VALTSGVEAEPSELRLAPGLLEQVLTNLTVNSIIHAFPDTSEVASAANPLVHIALRATPESLSILVSDNGCGMSEEVQKKVFDPFFTTRRGRGGTGLGMHIVHQIVVGQLGGAVDLESAPGSGTRWTIRIPVLDGTLSAVGMEPKVSA
jgi:signal transduction histidine kinase